MDYAELLRQDLRERLPNEVFRVVHIDDGTESVFYLDADGWRDQIRIPSFTLNPNPVRVRLATLLVEKVLGHAS